ncbi:UDP-N-acetylmuramate dehydrogenase [Devosia sp.]|uniref:UDP-N-acetylmuramate dehydrogenase n=1 Tax=Devosia sp. TaxID=1871048 RepID=UPI003A922A06
MKPDLLAALRLTGAAVTSGVHLAPLSRWKIGGRAAALVEPDTPEQAAAVLRVMANRTEPLFVMGDASNVLFDSAGFAGVVLRISRRMSALRISGSRVWAEAGIWMPQLARRAGSAGLRGLEHTIGIPGTLGGLILMNGGSLRKGIGLNVLAVHCAGADGECFTLDQAACGFDYRTSALQRMRAVVLAADLELEPEDSAAIRRDMLAIMRERRAKFPQSLANCGSTFLSTSQMHATIGPPGRAIQDAGLKGIRRNGAQISPMHGNFLVNTGGATSDDILWLIALIRQTVKARTGFLMDCEVRHLAPDGRLRPAQFAADERWGDARLAELADAAVGT